MASAKILLFTHKKLKNGTHPIVLQIIKDRRRKIISLGYSTKIGQWDAENNLPNRTHPNYKQLRITLREKLNQAERVIIKLDETDKLYTIEEIINILKINKRSTSVFGFTEQLIKKLDKTGRTGNARVYQYTLIVFKKFRKTLDLEFNDLNYKIIKGFEEYLMENGRMVNSISVYLRTLRAVYNKAIKENAAQESLYPFKNYKIKNESTLKRAVSKEDIIKVRKLELEEGSEQDKARDYFLFSFYMRGMSFIDIAYLKVKDIINGRILYSRKKTGQKFSIKITNDAEKIINKYSDLKDNEDLIFPIIKRKGNEFLDYRNAIRLTNKKLKVIGEMVDIKIPLTTYVARHSWGTIGKRLGHSIAKISEGFGHDSERTTQIYLASFEQEEIDRMNEEITK